MGLILRGAPLGGESERLENERLENERLESERLESERLESERLESERLESERLLKCKIECENSLHFHRPVLKQSGGESPLTRRAERGQIEHRKAADYLGFRDFSLLVNDDLHFNGAAHSRRFGDRRIGGLHLPQRLALQHPARRLKHCWVGPGGGGHDP